MIHTLISSRYSSIIATTIAPATTATIEKRPETFDRSYTFINLKLTLESTKLTALASFDADLSSVNRQSEQSAGVFTEEGVVSLLIYYFLNKT